MIKKAAAGYAGWLCANGIVAPEKNKIYAYGMELVLSGLVNVLSVLLISILLFHPVDGLISLWRSFPCGRQRADTTQIPTCPVTWFSSGRLSCWKLWDIGSRNTVLSPSIWLQQSFRL